MQKLVSVSAGQTLEENLVKALLNDPVPADVHPAVPEGTKLLRLDRSGSTVVIDLSLNARNVENAQQLYFMRVCLAETLCGVNGIESVDVLIAGRSECPTALPLGALSHEDTSFVSRWAQLNAEADTESDSQIERRAVLYYPSRDGRFLIPRAQTIDLGEDSAAALTAALALMPDDPLLSPALPSSGSSLIAAVETVDLPEGRRVLRLSFDGSLTSLLERSDISAWSMYAALTCTLTGFLPGLDGIQIYFGSGQLVRAESPEGEITLEDGVMTRSLFEDMICRTETVYMTAEDGSLRALTRALRSEDALSPRMVLNELFDQPRNWETGTLRVVPDGLSANDILGIRIENGEAVLNFSADFYAGCQRLTAQQERNLIYAFVNTLTNRPDVKTVRFQIEGETVATLVGSISLMSPLMRNPGLIS